MKISMRANQLPYSPIRKLVPYADIAKSKGIHVFHLNIGQPDIQTPDQFLSAIRDYDVRVLEYGPSNGLYAYRNALVEYYRRCDISIMDREIFITTAGSEAILFSIFGVCDTGDNILVMEPFYTNYNGFAAMAGVEILGVPTCAENGFAIPDLVEFEKKMNDRTKAIVICNPNNPTGAVYSRESLEKLAQFVIDHHLFLISDEVYREFTYDGAYSTSVMHLENLGDRAVMVDSVSKRYSACGARIGCIVTHNTMLLDAVMRMGQARLCPPTLEQIGAMAAIGTPEKYLRDVIQEYQLRRDVLYDGLNAIAGVYCEKPAGAFYMMVTLPVDDSDDFARFMLEDFSYENKTVMVAPGSGFYSTPGMGKNQVRMAYVLKKDDLEMSVKVLEKGLQAYHLRSH